MGRWAKSHDQRKGQWLVNQIRFAKDFPYPSKSDIKRLSSENVMMRGKVLVELKLWNMTNEEFEEIMEKYND